MSLNGLTPDSLLLTSEGYISILQLRDREFLAWNGEEFISSRIVKVADLQKVLRCVFNNGIEVECPENFIFQIHRYHRNRRFGMAIGYMSLSDLTINTRIMKYQYPVISSGDREFPYAYTHGYYTGAEKFKRKRLVLARSAVYGMRRPALEYLELDPNVDQKISLHFPQDIPADFEVPLSPGYSFETRLLWLAGLFDSGLVKRKIRPMPIWDVYSESIDFLRQVQLLLNTLGVTSRVIANNDLGRAHFTLRISGMAAETLRKHRVPVKNHQIASQASPKERAAQFPGLLEIIDDYKRSDLYGVVQDREGIVVVNGLFVPTEVD